MSDFKPAVPERLASSTICLTGFSGYVGSHLLETLRRAGLRPFLVPRPDVALPEIPGADSAAPWKDADELAEQITLLHDPIILNIAGHFVSRHTPRDLPQLISGNFEFPLQIFEALTRSGHGRIVNVGTSWEYTDTGAPEPANLYAQLKSTNAKILEWHAKRAPLRAVNLKLNDTYGGNDQRTKLMPLLKKRSADGKEAQLRSRAQPINLLHITDVQEGILAAASRTSEIEPGNVSTAFLLADETIKLGNLVDRLSNRIAPGLSVHFEDQTEGGSTLRGIWEGAPRLPSWSPRVSLEDGLRDYFGEVT